LTMNDKVLCVDDDAFILDAYRAMHKQLQSKGRTFLLETAENAEQALAAITGQGPFAVIISDMQLPGMDGVQLLHWVKEICPNTVRIMLTGAATLQVAVDALHEGSVFRFFTKPCNLDTFERAITAGLDQYKLLRSEKELLEKTLTGSIELVTGMLALVSPTAFGRAGRIRQRVKQIAQELKVDNAWQFEVVAMLSQSGCITLPEEVIGRIYRGAAIAPQEWKMFAQHPRVGHDLIAHIPRLEPVARAIAYQEKHYDGSGTPEDEVKGDAIPLAARVLKVALDLDTLESQGLSPTDALKRLRQRAGWYDPAVINALEALAVNDVDLVLKEMTLKSLTDKLNSANPLLGRLILADNVCSKHGMLVLSKGHEVTLPLLMRLQSFSHHGDIQEPIRVWVPAHE
jgi:response regulator RpfG family c-di-GMP phosphodiesterase